MIKQISWEEILFIWSTYLWPSRKSPIESHSAMCYLKGLDIYNMHTTPTFLGYFKDNDLVGVNSGHGCANNNYRSRGLWVNPNYRNQGIGTTLLLATIEQAILEKSDFIWSFPRYSSKHTYESAGFTITSDWIPSETSEQNAYCIKKLQ